MRTPALIIGVLLLLLGTAIAAGLLDFRQKEKVVDLGGLEINRTEDERPPPTLGYVLVALGAGALVAGALARR